LPPLVLERLRESHPKLALLIERWESLPVSADDHVVALVELLVAGTGTRRN